MATFGIIGEGFTDQITVENILMGYTEDKSLPVTYLQPKAKEDPAGWGMVFSYCASDNFRAAFAFNDFIVIQVDTDFFRGDSVPAELRIELMHQKTPRQVVDEVKLLLIRSIGETFYAAYQHQIIFAIAVDAIECWFLAIYYPDNKAAAAKSNSCIENLNKKIASKEEFVINKKEAVYYRKLSKHFRKKSDLLKYSQPNISFNAFIEELNQKLTPSKEANA